MRNDVFDLLLPAAARTAELQGNVPESDELYPEEITHLRRSVPKRRADFTTARRCARTALAQLGVPRPPMVPGERGAPRWPDGIVGSMTHCAALRAAAVARAEDLAGVGIDAEVDAPLPDGVLDTVALPGEIESLRRRAVRHADRVLFSAKESVYKVWFPLMGTWLGFEEAEIAIDPDGTLRAHLLADGPLVGGDRVQRLEGRWAAGGGVIRTAFWIPAPPTT